MNIDQPGTLVAASSSYDFRLPSSLEEAWKGVFGGEELKRGTYKMDDVRMNLGGWCAQQQAESIINDMLMAFLGIPRESIQGIALRPKEVMLSHLRNRNVTRFDEMLNACGVTEGLPVSRSEFHQVLDGASQAVTHTVQRQSALEQATSQALNSAGQRQAVLENETVNVINRQQALEQGHARIANELSRQGQTTNSLAGMTDSAIREQQSEMAKMQGAITANRELAIAQDKKIDKILECLKDVSKRPITQPVTTLGQIDASDERVGRLAAIAKGTGSEDVPTTLQAPQAHAKVVFTTTRVEDRKDVLQWREAIEEDATGFIRDLRFKYTSGCTTAKPGDRVLLAYFEMLVDWIRVAEQVDSWEEMPEMVSLGNRGLSLLRAQQGYVVQGARLSDVLTEMEAKESDNMDKSIIKASKKKSWTPKQRPSIKPFLGPRGRGAQVQPQRI